MELSRRSLFGLAAAGLHGIPTLGSILAPPHFDWPIDGAPGPPHPVCDAFGPRVSGEYDWHTGIDLLGVPGRTLVRAAADGRVSESAGESVELRHGAHRTLYSHLAARFVRTGQPVGRGQPLGLVGPPHLHFEIREGARPVNPYGLLRFPERKGHQVQILWVDSLYMPHTVDVHLEVTTPREELDLDRVVVQVSDFETGEPLDRQWVGFNAGHNCGGPAACAGAGILSVCLQPFEFSHTAPEWKTGFSFKRMRSTEMVVVEAGAIDCRGNVRTYAVVAP